MFAVYVQIRKGYYRRILVTDNLDAICAFRDGGAIIESVK